MPNSTHRTEVLRLGPILPHPNADRLGIVMIFGGYSAVVGLDQWHEGDLAAYVTPDSVVPLERPEFAFLAEPLRHPDRTHHRVRVMYRALDAHHATRPISVVVHGAARGADTLAERWAADRGVNFAAVPALWGPHGKGAGPRRNAAMLALRPDVVIAFPGGRGTADMVEQAERREISVIRPEVARG